MPNRFTHRGIILFLLTISLSAAVIRVPQDFSTIQGGINAAVTQMDTVLVSPGTYYEHINFFSKEIVVGSLFITTFDTSYITQTIIDGSSTERVVTLNGSETALSKLSGFTIQNGFTTNSAEYDGAGKGGGVYIGSNASPVLDNLVIQNSYAQYGGGGVYSHGFPLIINSTIRNNQTGTNGGGINSPNGVVDIKNTIIARNSGDRGGGIYSTSIVNINRSRINNNVATEAGGGLANIGSSMMSIINCTIAANEAPTNTGGGLFAQNSSITNISNSILFFNTQEQVSQDNNTIISIEYSDCENGQTGFVSAGTNTLNWNQGNIIDDPLFTDSGNSDFTLQQLSPCIDTGNPDIDDDGTSWETDEDDQDPDGTRMDMGAYYFYHQLTTPPDTIWTALLGGVNPDRAYDVQQTTDGGSILAGYTESFGFGGQDFWLVKTDHLGNEEWTRTFGGAEEDRASSVQQTTDGGFILTGYTRSFGDIEGDFWLIKTDANGNEEWNQTFGGPGGEWAFSVQQTHDGGYLIAGYTESFGAGNQDGWLIKTNTLGVEEWSYTYGGPGDDRINSAKEILGGGYILGGATDSYSGGPWDGWLIKTDQNGNEEWDFPYGGTGNEQTFQVEQTADEGFIFIGYTESYGSGGQDSWLVKTDASGNEEWNRTFGNTAGNYGYDVRQTIDGGFIVSGADESEDGSSYWDFSVRKTDSVGLIEWEQIFGGIYGDWGQSIEQTSDAGYMAAGYSNSFGNGQDDFWLLRMEGDQSAVHISSPSYNFAISENDTLAIEWNSSNSLDADIFFSFNPQSTFVQVGEASASTGFYSFELPPGVSDSARVKLIVNDGLGSQAEGYSPFFKITYSGPVWHISTNGSDENGDGSMENPYASIQFGIDASQSGDTVLVQPGTYIENINYNGKTLVIGSLTLSTDNSDYIGSTIIDGNQNGSVATITGVSDTLAELNGFTLTNGLHSGGGIFCENANPLLMNLVITDNTAPMSTGGGIFLQHASPTITNVVVANNTAYDNNRADGGGIQCGVDSYPSLTNVTIYRNSCDRYGGGINFQGGVDTLIICKNINVFDNTAPIGGGIYWESAENIHLINSNICSNSGDGIYVHYGTPVIINSIITDNTGYGVYGAGSLLISYSDVWNNGSGNYNDCDPGLSCIEQNPIFIDPANGDYHLESTSPCIDLGDPDLDNDGDPWGIDIDDQDPDGTRMDMGALYFDQTVTYEGPIWHVSTEGSDESGNGTEAFPFASIQFGIGASYDGDTVLVYPGTYPESINNIHGKNIVIGSLFLTTGDTSNIESTIIDGGENPHTVEFNNSEDSTTTLIGFTVLNGATQGIFCENSSPTISNCIVSQTLTHSRRGIWCLGSSPRIDNVAVIGNHDIGIWIGYESHPLITNSTSSNNGGGGIHCTQYSNPTLIDVISEGNNDVAAGGGFFADAWCNPILKRVTIRNNQAGYNGGGGVYVGHDSNVTLDSVLITGNSATDGGGAIRVVGNATLTATRSEVSNNSSNYNAGSYFGEDGSTTSFDHCTVYGGGIYLQGYYSNTTSATFTNSIIWECSVFAEQYAEFGISFSDIQNGWDGTGNLDLDPLFIDALNGNFHLSEDSPCIDTGNPTSPLEPDGSIADLGAYYFDQTSNSPQISISADSLVFLVNTDLGFEESQCLNISNTGMGALEVSIFITSEMITDIDGNIYRTVQIGDQIWMAENLKVTHFNDGSVIPYSSTIEDWNSTSEGAYCFYNFNASSESETYGGLYNWHAISDSRGVSPDGWHVPTDEEWMELEMELGMDQSEAEDFGWRGTNQASMLAGNSELWNNGDLIQDAEFGSSDFTALPSGFRNDGGGDPFSSLGTIAYFWSNSEWGSEIDHSAMRLIQNNESRVARNGALRGLGFAIRCLKDISINQSTWLDITPNTFTIPTGENVELIIAVNAEGLELGDYSDVITLVSNDSSNETLSIPITLEVIDQNIWHVSIEGSDETGNGSLDLPFATIQRGVNQASQNDTILIGSGTYTEPININTKSLYLRGINSTETIIAANYVYSRSYLLSQTVSFQDIRFESNSAGNDYMLWGECTGCSGEDSVQISFTDIIADGSNEKGFLLTGERTKLFVSNSQFYRFEDSPGNGAVFNLSMSSAEIEHSVFLDNHVSGNGQVVYATSGSSVKINFSSLSGNGINPGSIALNDGSDLVLSNSILWGTPNFQIVILDDGAVSSANISYCDIANGQFGIEDQSGTLDLIWGDGNINILPEFVSETNLALQPSSPCIDGGDPDEDTDGDTWEIDIDDRDPDGTRFDIGAFYYDQTDSLSPSVTLNFPEITEVPHNGDTLLVTWEASDNVGLDWAKLWFSSDGGESFILSDSLNANVGQVEWIAPDVISNSCILAIWVSDQAGNVSADTLDSTFPIDDGTLPIITVLTPTVSSTISEGDTLFVSWEASDNVGIEWFDLYYYNSPSSPETSCFNIPASERSFAFEIPRPGVSDSAQIRIEVMDLAANINNDYSEYFSITDNTSPQISILNPIAEQSYALAMVLPITLYNYDNVGVTSIDLNYSTDGGNNWLSIAQSIVPESDTLSYEWMIPNIPGTCLIQAIAHDAVGLEMISISDQFSVIIEYPRVQSYSNRIWAISDISLQFTQTMVEDELMNGIQVISNLDHDYELEIIEDGVWYILSPVDGYLSLDTLSIILNADILTNIYGYGLDGNRNGVFEGSPIDDDTLLVDIIGAGNFVEPLGVYDFDDFNHFVTAWHSDNYQYELAPNQHTIPHISIQPDSIFNIYDLATFASMWNWSVGINPISPQIGGYDIVNMAAEQDGNYLSVNLESADYISSQTIVKYDPSIVSVSVSDPGLAKVSTSSMVLVDANPDSGYITITSSQLSGKNEDQLNLALMPKTKQQYSIEVAIQGSDEVGNVTQKRTSIDLVPIPTTFSLSQNYPNPFNASTMIEYGLPMNTELNISIFDIRGRFVREMHSGSQQAGYHAIQWNGMDENGQGVASGLYFVVLNTPEYRVAKKALILK
ncbi:MAG: FISUMP domain-containing protein [Candidatus Marinimicrobia bacterium]|nr:FISUMP domain-containing protein [Candidatus Neomarinimicrobiota bacterium]